MKFISKTFYYAERERWGFEVFEIIGDERVLRLVSPGIYAGEKANELGMIAAKALSRVAMYHGNQLVAAKAA